MVGPDFHPPTAPETTRYTNPALPSKTTSIKQAGKAGTAQSFNQGQNIPAQWWALFHSPALNELIEIGLRNNPNLAAAKATLTQAQENLRAQWGNLLLPSANLQTSYERTRFSAQQFGSPVSNLFNLYTAQLSVGYTLDVFGGARRQIESYRAQVDYQQDELAAAQLTLTSNIATTAINIAALKAQIKATHSLIQASKHQLDLINTQFKLGGASKENVLTQQTFVAQTVATLPPLEKNLAQSRHAMAVLLGQLPSDKPAPDIELDHLTLPATLPISLPSRLVEQRPDIRASTALLHQASAQIGVATAKMLPQFPITANYGYLSDQLSTLFTSFGNVWSYGIQGNQALFQGGALLAQRRAAIAAYQAAFAQYQQTVLQAFQNVADSLRAIEYDANTFKAQKQAEQAALANLTLSQKSYQLGAISYLALLNAEQQYQQTVIASTQAQAARYSDTVALFQSLGGGWWDSPLEKKSL